MASQTWIDAHAKYLSRLELVYFRVSYDVLASSYYSIAGDCPLREKKRENGERSC